MLLGVHLHELLPQRSLEGASQQLCLDVKETKFALIVSFNSSALLDAHSMDSPSSLGRVLLLAKAQWCYGH